MIWAVCTAVQWDMVSLSSRPMADGAYLNDAIGHRPGRPCPWKSPLSDVHNKRPFVPKLLVTNSCSE